ncbi:MAG TPA: acetyl-CoA carboxylase biotin carboxylase subunit [Clostridia bacterium]|nr:acetyl-CoA carboxylase biotin carboxylase subunit [Clostridia bacterium]
MIKRILVANRGEIAVRIIRACRELDIETVAVYAKNDCESLHVKLADISVCIGSNKLSDSYLNIPRIITTAKLYNCDAIHPGYGFLSENSRFSQVCESSNIIFIGPKAKLIDLMGNKSSAREMMAKANVPIVPGTSVIETFDEGLKESKRIGFPVLIKASAGGGGKGMRIAEDENNFQKAYNTAKQEALNAFGDDRVYIEKLIEKPRHVEFQILADQHGNVIHLGERDCSIQRNHQKVIEESPSKIIDDQLREEMGSIAVQAAQTIGYTNAGTIEFLLDKNKKFYFIEMNTRIQVEHPVTEMITGIDLIKEQILIANGINREYSQEKIKFSGHAIECRVNAEDPSNNFVPSPGKVTIVNLPGGNGIRIDSFIYNGYLISPIYDSMITKIIVHGDNRQEAINKMKGALGEMTIEGIKLNTSFLFEIMEDKNFVNSNYDTSFIEKFLINRGDQNDW